jgi:small GTP-binding protein
LQRRQDAMRLLKDFFARGDSVRKRAREHRPERLCFARSMRYMCYRHFFFQYFTPRNRGTDMLNKKVCMLGAFAVGKSALVQQYVYSIFSDSYLSTVGVKISKKSLDLDGQDMTLVLWDLEGKDDYVDVNISYLRGAMGFFVVCDGTRLETLGVALTLRDLAVDLVGPVPHAVLVNKADLADKWEISEAHLAALTEKGIRVLKTSAKTGFAVEDAFSGLARDML